MFKNILIPTDGSELSEKVVDDAIELAKATHAKVTALHVYAESFMVPYGGFGPGEYVVDEDIKAAAIRRGKEYVERIGAAARKAGIPFEGIVLESAAPWKGIVDTAERRHCDLVMMAAHGYHGLQAMVIGSETNKVLTHAKIPVLVYH
jgi:nucleotide-binding universal stress UspA family protein